jgi:ribosome-associated translation inhibitor RaiA
LYLRVTQMKKIAAIFLLTIYSLTTLGVGIRQFYCCGKLKSTNITLVQETKEKCSNSDAMKGCCKTKFKSLKVKDNHIAGNCAVHFIKQFTDLNLPTTEFEIKVALNKPAVVANASHAPPLHRGVPIYILNCTYRI